MWNLRAAHVAELEPTENIRLGEYASVVPFEKAADAHRLMEPGTRGRIIVSV